MDEQTLWAKPLNPSTGLGTGSPQDRPQGEAYTARQLIEMMPQAFQPDKAAGVKARIQFRLTGEGGGDWVMNIAEGQCTVAEGTTESPNLTLTMAASDYVNLATGKLDGTQAFMMGKLKLSGDFGLATRLLSFFKMPR